MTASRPSHLQPLPELNSLRDGGVYRATTLDGLVAVGEYLGVEVTHGEWAIMLRSGSGTMSLPLHRLGSVLPMAA